MSVLIMVIPSLTHAQHDDIHMNKVIEKLQKEKVVTGIWARSLTITCASSLIEFNGFPSQEDAINTPMIDFIVIDMESYPYDITKLRTFLAGLNSKREVLAKGNLQPSLATFVRIPAEGNDPDHSMIKQVLDVGVHGIIIPHVRTPEEALHIVKSCRYVRPANSPYRNPVGNRGYYPAICAYQWGLTGEEYYKRADVWPLNPNGDIMVIIMIEDTDGVRNIEKILKVPGIGAVFFGPSDYKVSSGNLGNESYNESEALNTVKAACDAAGIPCIGFATADTIEQKISEKYKMLLIGSDMDISGGASRVLDYLKTRY